MKNLRLLLYAVIAMTLAISCGKDEAGSTESLINDLSLEATTVTDSYMVLEWDAEDADDAIYYLKICETNDADEIILATEVTEEYLPITVTDLDEGTGYTIELTECLIDDLSEDDLDDLDDEYYDVDFTDYDEVVEFIEVMKSDGILNIVGQLKITTEESVENTIDLATSSVTDTKIKIEWEEDEDMLFIVEVTDADGEAVFMDYIWGDDTPYTIDEGIEAESAYTITMNSVDVDELDNDDDLYEAWEEMEEDVDDEDDMDEIIDIITEYMESAGDLISVAAEISVITGEEGSGVAEIEWTADNVPGDYFASNYYYTLETGGTGSYGELDIFGESKESSEDISWEITTIEADSIDYSTFEMVEYEFTGIRITDADGYYNDFEVTFVDGVITKIYDIDNNKSYNRQDDI